MRQHVKTYLATAVVVALAGAAFANSTINPSVPAQNAPMASAPIRLNFQAAYNDINNILGQYNGSSAPSNPTRYQYWLDTTTNPSSLKIYDGLQWVTTGQLNTSAHTWASTGSYIGTPVAPAYGGTGQNFSAATGALSFTAGTTSVGTLGVSYGGTGATTITGLVVGNGTSAMSAYAGTSCTNQFPRSVSAAGAWTCATVQNTDLANSSITLNGTAVDLGGSRTLTLASSDFVNQGTLNTVLHGNASGNPVWGAVSLTADVSGILPGANGGTANGFTAFSGPATSLKTFTLPNASATILTTNAAVTVPQGGTGVATLTGLALGNGTSPFSAYAGSSGSACSNQFTTNTSLNASGVVTNTCTTATLASAQFANQGTTTTVLHGNASGNPSWGAIAIGSDVSGLGTGIASALGTNVGSAGAPVLFNGALGTPSSGTATNLTGTAAGLTAGTATNWSGNSDAITTATITFGGGSTGMTLTRAALSYTKNGRNVLACYDYNFTAKGSSTGSAVINLPFTAQNDTFASGGGSITYYYGMSSITSPILVAVNRNSTTADLYLAGTGTVSAVTDANFSDVSSLAFCITYRSAS